MADEIRLPTREELLESEEVREMISMRAYEIFERRGREPGHEASDWLQAENEIIALLLEEQRRLAEAQARTLAALPESNAGPVQQHQQAIETDQRKSVKKKSADRQKKSKSEDGEKPTKKSDSKSRADKSADVKKKKK